MRELVPDQKREKCNPMAGLYIYFYEKDEAFRAGEV
jgi:hypothetical protein